LCGIAYGVLLSASYQGDVIRQPHPETTDACISILFE
jgi:hypothetical protein